MLQNCVINIFSPLLAFPGQKHFWPFFGQNHFWWYYIYWKVAWTIWYFLLFLPLQDTFSSSWPKWLSLSHFRLNLIRLFLIHFFRCKLVFEVWHSVLVHHIFGSRLTWRIYLLPAKNNKSVIKREITTSAWHECHLCWTIESVIF